MARQQRGDLSLGRHPHSGISVLARSEDGGSSLRRWPEAPSIPTRRRPHVMLSSTCDARLAPPIPESWPSDTRVGLAMPDRTPPRPVRGGTADERSRRSSSTARRVPRQNSAARSPSLTWPSFTRSRSPHRSRLIRRCLVGWSSGVLVMRQRCDTPPHAAQSLIRLASPLMPPPLPRHRLGPLSRCRSSAAE